MSGEKTFYFSFKLESQSGNRTRDLQLSKQAALTTVPGPPPWFVGGIGNLDGPARYRSLCGVPGRPHKDGRRLEIMKYYNPKCGRFPDGRSLRTIDRCSPPEWASAQNRTELVVLAAAWASVTPYLDWHTYWVTPHTIIPRGRGGGAGIRALYLWISSHNLAEWAVSQTAILYRCSVFQRQTTVTAYLYSKQLLLFVFELQDSLLPSSTGILTVCKNKQQ